MAYQTATYSSPIIQPFVRIIFYYNTLAHIHSFILSRILIAILFIGTAQLPYVEGMQYKETRDIPTFLYIILLIINI